MKHPVKLVAPAPEVVPVSMPVLGEILLVNTGDGLAPMIVSRVGEADFDGHAFLAGTQVMEITNATYGAGYGQCVPPTNPNSKEA